MNASRKLLITLILTSSLAFSQAPFEMSFGSTNPSNGVLLDEEINEINGSDYSILTTAINT
ncbi:MAG: hypothetical protein KJP09_06655, partial [Bacteroidia bacterium]|nr:hypothetical protein [Bacteroidia bacterium]NNK29105.1 hypothetical protein [Flavobacteriaceae bacterium]